MPTASAVGVHGRKGSLPRRLARPTVGAAPASRAFLCLYMQYNIVFQFHRDAINTDPSTDMRPMKTRIINMYCSLRVTTANRNPEDRMPHMDRETTGPQPVFGDNGAFPFYPANAEPDTSESLFCITVACSAPTFSRNPRLKLQNIAPFKRQIHSVRMGTRRYRFQYRKRGA